MLPPFQRWPYKRANPGAVRTAVFLLISKERARPTSRARGCFGIIEQQRNHAALLRYRKATATVQNVTKTIKLSKRTQETIFLDQKTSQLSQKQRKMYIFSNRATTRPRATAHCCNSRTPATMDTHPCERAISCRCNHTQKFEKIVFCGIAVEWRASKRGEHRKGKITILVTFVIDS